MEPRTRTLAGLREHLFDALEGLQSKDAPMDIERAEAVAHVSGQIINAAKVELQFLQMVGQDRLSSVVEPAKTGRFFEPAKGLSTGKQLGGGNGK